jgi:cytochrome c556
MRRALGILVAASLFAGVSLPPSAAEDTKAKSARELIMKKKLEHAQKLLEGIAMRDFELIEKQADNLVLISKKAEFLALKTPDYTMYSDDFRRNAERAVRMAREKNIDGAALAYVQMTMNCVNCHKYVREVRMASRHTPENFPETPLSPPLTLQASAP